MTKLVLIIAMSLSTISFASPLQNICKNFDKALVHAQDGSDYYAALESQVLAPLEKAKLSAYAKGLRDSIIIDGSSMFNEEKECSKIKVLDSCLDGLVTMKKFKSKKSLSPNIYQNILNVYVIEELKEAGLIDLVNSYKVFTKVEGYSFKTCSNLSEDI